MNGIIVRQVTNLETGQLHSLVEESANEGFRHLRRLVNDYETGANRFDQEGEALFIAYQDNEIVGVCGLNRDPYADSAMVGRVRRLYVSPSARRFGVGRQLMESVVAEAGHHYEVLVLKTDNPGADHFYRSLGFSVYDGSENNSHYLLLNLRSGEA